MSDNQNYPTYEEYIAVCELLHSNKSAILSKEAYAKMIEGEETPQLQAAFQMDPARVAGAIGAGVAGIQTLNDKFGKFKSTLGAGKFGKAQADAFFEMASELNSMRDQFIKVNKGGNMDGDSGGGDNSGFGGDGTPNDPFDANRMNFNVFPTEVRLSTGIKTRAYGKLLGKPNQNYQPLFIAGCKLKFPDLTTPDSEIAYFMEKVVAPTFQAIAQAKVGFDLNVKTKLSATRLFNYLDALAEALQYYYFYASIFSYESGKSNRNMGMLRLYDSIGAGQMTKLLQLKRLLEKLPIPPNLHSICFYLMQTYKQTSIPGSPIVKFMPFPFNDNGTGGAPVVSFGGNQGSELKTAIDNLTTDDMTETWALISRICPHWLNEDMMAAPVAPIHDPNFMTIWTNSPSALNAGSGWLHNPTVNSFDEQMLYSNYAEPLDGAAYGLTSVWNGSSGLLYPGLLTVLNSPIYGGAQYHSRWQYGYGTITSGESFQPCYYEINSLGAGMFTTMYTSSGYLHHLAPGAEVIEGVTVNTIRESAYDLAEWCVSLDLIEGKRVPVVDTTDDMDSKPKRRRRRR